MGVIDRGTGVPLVLIPGIQGRWEYLGPAVDALAASFRVLTSSDFTDDDEQIQRALDDRHIDRAVICGVSLGGLIALQWAAAHPDRTAALILVSTPGPDFRLLKRHRLYARAPWFGGILFFAESPLRLGPEIRVALPGLRNRFRFTAWQLRTLLTAPLSVTKMARRAAIIERLDRTAAALRVSAPTLIVTGEPRLDRVVSAAGTQQYSQLISGAHTAVVDGTGHLGSITKPQVFAGLVGDFVRATQQPSKACVQGRAS